MKHFYHILFLALALQFVVCACEKDEAIDVTPTARGTVMDVKENEYEWVRIGHLDWTTRNVRCGTPCYQASYTAAGWPSQVFSAQEQQTIRYEYMPTYGNLITLEEAEQYAPEGWRVPTDEDWQQLEKALGMSDAEAARKGWRGTNQGTLLMQPDSLGGTLQLQLGGALIWSATITAALLSFVHEGEYGYYWTSTVDPEYTDFKAVYCRKLCYGQGQIERQSVNSTNRYFSCRWVRDAKE